MPRRNKLVKSSVKPLISTCTSKRKYSSEKQARDTAEYQMLINSDLELSVYKCDICQKWHLTRQKNKN
jgi:hypothetical protein